MDIIRLQKELREYAKLISDIRVLSAVSLDGMEDEDSYAKKLSSDYKRIGELGVRCRQILEETVYPLIRQKERLTAEEVAALQDFCDLLIEPASGEELDLFLLHEVSKRLLGEPSLTSDDNALTRQLNTHVSVCYANVNRTSRISASRDICTYYRDDGLEAAYKAIEFVNDRDRFLALDNDGKIYILRIYRFYSALYDTFFHEEDTNRARFEALVNAFKLADDPFFTENVKDYNWKRHRIRCMEHMGQLTERGNRWGFSEEQCRDIYERISGLSAIKEEDEAGFFDIIPESHYSLLILRNSYFAKHISDEEYRERLILLYDKYSDAECFDMYAAQMNILIPLEYISSLRGERITVRIQATLKTLYNSVIEYVMRSVNLDAFNFLQEYLVGFLEEFIEVPGVMSFMDMGLSCMAALHPPTFVHSFQVADITRCLIEHLYMHDEKRRAHVEVGAYRAALCHDFGKLAMIDSIFIYGRDLFNGEFDIIHLHTDMGVSMLKAHNSTSDYAKYAGEHHLWYDGTGGYPGGGDRPALISSVISVADSIDAATDDIGRSYRKGKTLDEICEEIRAESGSRYSPPVAELLSDESVKRDLEFILTEGRQARYRRLYQMLSGISAR